MAAAAIGGLPAPAADDPILAVIDDHGAALAAKIALLDQHHRPPSDSDAHIAASDRQEAAWDALFSVVPTTAAGAMAWLEYVANPDVPGDPDACFLTYRDTQATVAKQMRAVLTVAKQSRAVIAVLLSLSTHLGA